MIVGSLINFLSVGDHSEMLATVKRLETVVSHPVSSFPVIYSRRESLVQVTSSCLEVEEPIALSNVKGMS